MRLTQLEQAPHPRELDKATLPTYIIEPPDILVLQAVSTLRPPESLLRAGDRLNLQLKNGLPIEVGADAETNPLQFNAEMQIEARFKLISGSYLIGSDGTLNLGPAYGKIAVAHMTVAQATDAIRQHLEQQVGLKAPELMVSLDDLETPQAISGDHLVRPDGRLSLGIYGEVFVAGMSLLDAKLAIEQQLATYIQDPQITVDVAAYNSKIYYVVIDGGGYGEQVIRLPYTGNETVLDAISQIQGLPSISSKRIWIARPTPSCSGVSQILEVSWEDITALGQTATNYQVLPGDRIYIQADHWVSADNFISKVVAPMERVMGVTLLGFGVVRSSKSFKFNNSGGGVF